MSEEVKKASTTMPRVMMLTVLINGILAFGFLIALLFSVGDIEAALSSPTGYPIIQIFYQATGSVKGATLMMSAIIVIAFCSAFGILASVSRLTWAFARDQGLPFSNFFAHVSSTRRQSLFLTDADLGQIGQPSLPHSRASYWPRYQCCHPPLPHQHRLLNRPQRHRLTLYSGPLHLIPYPDRASHHETCQVQVDWPDRALYTGPLGSPYQRLRDGLRCLHLHISAIPKLHARHSSQHELCQPSVWVCSVVRRRVLVRSRQVCIYRSHPRGLGGRDTTGRRRWSVGLLKSSVKTFFFSLEELLDDSL